MAHISKIGSGEFTIEFWLNIKDPDQRRFSLGHGLNGIFSTLPDGHMGDDYSKNPFLPGGGNHKVKPVINARDLNTYTDGIVGGFAIGYVYNFRKFLEKKRGGVSGLIQGSTALTHDYFTRFNDGEIRLVWIDGTQIENHRMWNFTDKIVSQQQFLLGGVMDGHFFDGNIQETDIYGPSNSPQAGDDEIQQSVVFLGNRNTDVKTTSSVEGDDDGLVIPHRTWTHIAITRKNDVVVPSIARPGLYSTQAGKTLDSIEFYIDGKKKSRIFIPKDTDYSVDREAFTIGEIFRDHENSKQVQMHDSSLAGFIDLFTIYDHAERTADFTPPLKPASDSGGDSGDTIVTPTPPTQGQDANCDKSPRNTTSASNKYRSLIVYQNLQGEPVTGVGPIIIPDPEIDGCYVNDCENHYIQTGTRNDIKVPQRYLSSGNVVIEEPIVPFHTNKNFIDVGDAGITVSPIGGGHTSVDAEKLIFGIDSEAPNRDGQYPTHNGILLYNQSTVNETTHFTSEGPVITTRGYSINGSHKNAYTPINKWSNVKSLSPNGLSLRFDGTNADGLHVGDGLTPRGGAADNIPREMGNALLANGGWTIELWFNQDSHSNIMWQPLLVYGSLANNTNHFSELFHISIAGIYADDESKSSCINVHRMGPSNNWLDGVTTQGRSVLEEWNHLAVTQTSDGTLKIYLNGKLQRGQRTNQLSWENARQPNPANHWQNELIRGMALKIGYNGGNPYRGYMDRIYIHNFVKYTENFTPERGGAGSTAVVTPSNPIPEEPTICPIKHASCFFESGYLTTEVSEGFNYSDTGKNFTVEFWANFENHNTGVGINNVPLFSFVNDQSHQIGLGYRIDDTDRNKRTLMFYENNSGIEHTGFNYTGWFTDTGEWYHISVVRDDDGYKAFQGSYGENVGPSGGTGLQYGNTISLDSLQSHWPTGKSRFIMGGLVSGTFTGNNNDYTQEFSNDAHTVLLSNFNETISDESSNSFNYTISSGAFKDSLGNDPTYAVISGLGDLTGKNNEVYSLEPKQGTGFLTINPGSKNALNYAAGQNNHNLDSYAYVDSTGFNFGTGDFSVECWMKPRGDYQTRGDSLQPSNKECVVWAIGDFGSAWKTGNGIALTYNNFFDQDELSLCFGSNLGINKFSIAKNTDMRFGWLGAEYENELPWNHVLVQRLSGNFECYLNGQLFETVTTKDLTEHALTKYSITSAPDINNPNQKFFLGGMNGGLQVYEYPSDKRFISVRGNSSLVYGETDTTNPFTGIYSFLVATGRELRSGLADSDYIHDSGNINYGHYRLVNSTDYPNYFGKPTATYDNRQGGIGEVFEPVNHFYAKGEDEFGFFTFKIPVTGVGPNDTSVVEIEAEFASWQPEGIGKVKGIGGGPVSWHMNPVLSKSRDSHSHRITYGVNTLDQEESWSMPSKSANDYVRLHGPRPAVPGDYFLAAKVPRGITITHPEEKNNGFGYTTNDPKIHVFKKSFTVRSGDNLLLRYYKDGGVPLDGTSKILKAYESYTSAEGISVPGGSKIINKSQLPSSIGQTYYDNGVYMRIEDQLSPFWPSTERCEPISIRAKIGASEISSYHGHIDSLRVSKVARFSNYVDTGAFSGYLDADMSNVYIDELRISDSGRYTGQYGTTGYFYTDEKTQLLCHFNEHSGVIDFFDEHCGETGKYGTPLSGKPGDIVGTFGSSFYDVTGIQVGSTRVNAEEWNVINQDYIAFKIPQGTQSGPYYVMSDQFDEVTGCDLSLEPAEFKVLDFNPKTGHIGTEISISGTSLNLATSVSLSGDNSVQLFPTFTIVDSTGINFTVPPAAVTSKILVSANRLGDAQSQQTATELTVIKTGIALLDTTSGVYGQTVNLSGLNLDSATQNIFFEGFTTGDRNLVPPLSTTFIGKTGVQVTVPREIVRGSIILSGVESFIETTADFTPIPTISGFHNNELIVGQPFKLSGINASQIAPVLGFSGNSDQPYFKGDNIVEFIANSATVTNRAGQTTPFSKERTFRFGPIYVNTSQLEASAPNSYQTGYTCVSGVINSVVNGTGFPFLVSLDDTVSGSALARDYRTSRYNGFFIEQFTEAFKNGSGITHSLLSSVTGEKIVISGVEPNIIGIDPSRGDTSTEITVTGSGFYNVTGIRLTDVPSESTECFIESGDFVPQTGILTEFDALGGIVRTPHTGFHIKNLAPNTEAFSTESLNSFGHELTFKICSEFTNVDKAYIYSLNHTGTTGELTIPY